MAQAKINNNTVCEFATLFANDEQFNPLVTPIIKATFDISPDGKLKFAEKQMPVDLAGKYTADPETSSYLVEPETAFIKLTTDVVIIGDAISSRGPVQHLLVDIHVGDLHKQMAVFGDRHWIKQTIGYEMSRTTPFETMPLTYENAFGGWDRRHDDLAKQGFEARNTVGKGYFRTDVEHTDALMPLPNIENPNALISDIKDKPEPVGCGFTLPHWQPRAALAGTYDENWQKTRSPLLPEDFNRAYFNAASPGFIASQYLSGKEQVVIKNMTPEGHLQFQLPIGRPPVCEIELKDSIETLPTHLDTVIINTRSMQLQLIWRNYLLLQRGPHDVEAMTIN
ncbi:DUF2169 family type VI secretion system accessory protein [Agarilytica rhodophyticola]|uniref:DUF2169 family type VI secretion system accessory protein n=1 Tax=Agarilytica rhodophyticola TaxID=1737490 RepID=UPI000B347566|nr:DUF2169 domain-containing protein [Agarilytica rhodophyticola]